MADEIAELKQMLQAYIEATGYEVEDTGRYIQNGPERISVPFYKVTKKKPKPRTQAKQEGYSEPFEKFWKEYPKDHGGNKGKAYKQWAKRILEGGIPNASSIVWQMVNGMRNYTKFVEATGQTLKHPATFIGPDRFYLDDFTIPDSAKQKNKLKLPYDDNALDAFAVDHKLSRPRTGELGREYRARIQPDLDKLSANLA